MLSDPYYGRMRCKCNVTFRCQLGVRKPESARGGRSDSTLDPTEAVWIKLLSLLKQL